jgi:predicted nuclease with TOPRIM domain
MDPEIKQREKDICRLQEENAELRNAIIEELRKTIRELEAKNAQLEEKLSKVNDENNIMKQGLIDLQLESGMTRKTGLDFRELLHEQLGYRIGVKGRPY